MIPTPAKRRHQQQDFARKNSMGDDDDDEESDRALLFNGFSLNRSHKADFLPEDEPDEQTGELEEDELELEEDDDEFDCMRLDTIVEEDEGSLACCGPSSAAAAAAAMLGAGSDVNEDVNCDNERAVSQVVERIGAPDESANDDDDSNNKQAERISNSRPQAEQASSMRKFSNFQHSKQEQEQEQERATTTNQENNSKSELKSKKPASQTMNGTGNDTKQHLPSTNRLISEHQARQQQALFRALAERQKLMDELGGGQRVDLMSAASLAGSLKGRGRRSRRRQAARSSGGSLKRPPEEEEEGVPLSAVDLSSMSDRMLEELMGQIASASSSSLSSNGESLDSSDLSSSYDSDGATDLRAGRTRDSALQESSSAASDTPNVVGVHEDERQRVSFPRKPNCKSAHKQVCDSGHHHRDDKDDDDDHHNDQLLLKSPPPDSMSPLPPSPASRRPADEQPASHAPSASSKLEQYFTSNLVSPHEVAAAAAADAPSGRAGLSVEEVLGQMLEALQEIGCADGDPNQQEQLNELLERGFAHLEQLLNCSLTGGGGGGADSQATSGGEQVGANGTIIGHHINRSQQNLAQKVISNAATLSKDSDYGSDTQSADCFSHSTEPNSTELSPNKWAGAQLPESPKVERSSGAPSPSSLPAAPSSGALSPLAIELSFKLAEWLHKLAQQQQQARAKWQRLDEPEMQPEPMDDSSKQQVADASPLEALEGKQAQAKRSPMKSIVMLNGARPNSASSIVSSSSSCAESQRRNMTPPVRSDPAPEAPESARSGQAPPRQQFKTRVNLGTGEVSSVIVSAVEASSKLQISAQETGSWRQKEVVSESPQVFERRRSTRSSLRRRPSFSGSLSAGQPRPGSPLPRSLLAEAERVGVAAAAAASQREPSPTKRREESRKQEMKQEQQKEKQLQRALILAQKYNYSPAKLAASKLSSKLQLKESTSAKGK